MKYTVYANNTCIYDISQPGLTLTAASVSLELNKAGTFDFTIYPQHPAYNSLEKLKTVITVYRDNYCLFRGRVMSSEMGFYGNKQVSCEGELAFLCDSIIRPYNYSSGDKRKTVTEFFTWLINAHNQQVDGFKQFAVGQVTVTDGDTSNTENIISRSSIDYNSSWAVLNDKLLDMLGGYVWVEHTAAANTINYLADFNEVAGQPIELGKNLLNVDQQISADEVITRLIPLGKDKLTIATVNEGKDYIDASADIIAKFGYITAVATWDDVTVPANLLNKGRAYLATQGSLTATVELTAVDLAAAGYDIGSFKLGQKIRIIDDKHGISDTVLVDKLQINLLAPADNKIIVGKSFRTLTEQTASSASTATVIKEVATTAGEAAATAGAAVTAIAQRLDSDYYTSEQTETIIATKADAEAIAALGQAISDEATTRANADSELQRQIKSAGKWLTVEAQESSGTIIGVSVSDAQALETAINAKNYNCQIALTIGDEAVVCRYSAKGVADGGVGDRFSFIGYNYPLHTNVGFNSIDGVYTWFIEQT